MIYQSELIKEIVETRGHHLSSPHYESECVKSWIEETKGAYPKLCDYESEWLNYINENPLGVFPYETLVDITKATVDNVVPYAYKSAILKGSTKYLDIDTGDILDAFDESKNLELVSVKMPVLTTTGKNLFDGRVGEDKKRIISTGVVVDDSTFAISEYISVSPNKNYICNKSGGYGSFYDSDKKLISTFWNSAGALAPQNAHYVRISFEKTNMDDLQFEENSTSTSYEPFKSNILTVNEEIVLRSLPNGVKDTFNLVTREYVQRVGEIVFNGDTKFDDWGERGENGLTFNYYDPQVKQLESEKVSVFADTLLGTNLTTTWGGTPYTVAQADNGNYLQICLNKNDLRENTIVGINEYFLQYPAIVQYELATPIVKTVGLAVVNQDGDSLSKLIPIEGTMHLSTSSKTINPLFSGEIPVEAITQNLASFIGE